MSVRPWHKRYHSDALTGYRGLTLEERGAYSTILDLLYDSGEEALPAQERWMTGQLNCSARKWRSIKQTLLAAGKIDELPDGRITNARYLRERAKVADLSDKRAEAGRAGGLAKGSGHTKGLDSPMFDLNIAPSGDDQNDIDPPKPAENGEDAEAIAKAKPPVRARDPEARVQNPILPQPVVGDGEAQGGVGADEPKSRLHDGDLMDWYQAIAQASGHNPVMPGQIDRAMKFVEAWRKEGIDLDELILPTIKAMIASTSDPTRTLGRFDARIRHEHARKGATPAGRAYKAPASPIVDQPGEDDIFNALRADLLKAMGPQTFARYVNAVLFEDVPDAPGGRRIMRVIDKRSGPMVLMDDQRASTVRAVARKHGFDDVW